ncbi:PIN domain-containing protein [Candidatus Palauibacter sp.]|uniref:PIN domain-containing protein n=1 Tax=Candidatus Palauibacter sp. TaxID=3101350 RepID=UPI003C6FFEF3
MPSPHPFFLEVLIKRSPLETRQIIALLNKRGVFSIEPFDQRAAIELAQMLKKRSRKGPETWAKLKFDCQIVAIAKVGGATTIYSDDDDVYKLGTAAGIPVVRTRDLELPPDADQAELFPYDENDSGEREPRASH